MSLETRLTKLESRLQAKPEYPTYVSFTSEEYEILKSDNATQEEKETILARHNILGLKTGIKTYVGVSPDMWDEPASPIKVYVGVDIDKV